MCLYISFDLQELVLSNNEFTGALPYTINIAQDLRTLDLSNNKLTGPLPDMLTQQRMSVCRPCHYLRLFL